MAYNINAGHNNDILEKSRDLGEYAEFVAVVRRRLAEADEEEA